jgi:hypothetical protein
MRLAGALALAVLAVAAVGGSSAAAAGSLSHTALAVTFWPDGSSSVGKKTWILRCNPAGGTLPRPRVACARLAAGGWQLLAPVPANAICTEIYGGPQVARVVGYVEGRRVWTRFSRENGCHIARWNRVSPWLLPKAGLTP